METPLLAQPATEGIGPPRFEFDTDEPEGLYDYASMFRRLNVGDALESGLASAAEDGSDDGEPSPGGVRPKVVQLIVRERGAPSGRTAHELSLEVTLRNSAQTGHEPRTPEDAEGIDLKVTSGPEGEGRMNVSFSFSGLPVDSALELARFARALYRTHGTLSLRDTEDGEESSIGDLPVDVPASVAEENDDRLSALEALVELEDFVGERLTIPANSDKVALRDVSVLVDVVRSGTAVLPVAGFDVPVPPSTVREFLGRFDERGELVLALGAEGQAGPIDVLGPEIFLGPCRYIVQGARLVNSRAELEVWLSQNPRPGDAITLSWKPLEGYPVFMQYLDWPKPSRGWVEANISAFEEANGVDSADFERAYRSGEAWTNEVDRADIWLTLIDSRQALLGSPDPEDET